MADDDELGAIMPSSASASASALTLTLALGDDAASSPHSSPSSSPHASSPTSSSSDDDSSWEADSTSSTSSTDSASSASSDATSARRIRCARDELHILNRDNDAFARLRAFSPLAAKPNHDHLWTWLHIFSVAILVAIVVAASVWLVKSCHLSPPRATPVGFEDFAPIVRPSDASAMRKIAFHLPARWMEWVRHPPLGMSHWNEREPEEQGGARRELSPVRSFFQELQDSLEDVDVRMEYREEKRIAWAGDIKDIHAWLERVEECRAAGIQQDSAWIYQRLTRVLPPSWSQGAECQALLRHAAQDPTRIEQLRQLVDGIHSHLSYERNSVDLYLGVLAGLHLHAEAQMRTVNQDMRNLTVRAVQRHLDALPPGFFSRRNDTLSPVSLLSRSEKTQIAYAREEYGVLTFLAILSSTLLPAMRQRKARLGALLSQIAGLQDMISPTQPFDPIHRITTVAQRLPDMAELDVVLRETRLDAQLMRSSALEWMRTHTVSPTPPPNPPRAATHRLTSTLCAILQCAASRHLCHRPSPSLPPDIHAHTWLHPTLGAASWHWEGTRLPTPGTSSSEIATQIESALLFAGLEVPDRVDFENVLGVGERWEDLRFRMVERGDGADLRRGWAEGYGGGKEGG